MIGIRMASKAFTGGLYPPRTRWRWAWPRFPTRTIIIAFALLSAAGEGAAGGPIIGDAIVIDGDTIEIVGERIQLYGVDAPEDWQVCLDEAGSDYRCGKESSLALDAFLSASQPTRCEFAGRDRYGRYIGTCFRADGKDVNRWLVESGNAINRENHNRGLYASAQEMARSVGAGMWRGQPRTEGSRRVAEE